MKIRNRKKVLKFQLQCLWIELCVRSGSVSQVRRKKFKLLFSRAGRVEIHLIWLQACISYKHFPSVGLFGVLKCVWLKVFLSDYFGGIERLKIELKYC